MDINHKIEQVIKTYQSLHHGIKRIAPSIPGEPHSEHLDDLVALRDTALVLLESLVEFKDADSVPFDIDPNELSLTIDEFISTSDDVLEKATTEVDHGN